MFEHSPTPSHEPDPNEKYCMPSSALRAKAKRGGNPKARPAKHYLLTDQFN